jgi:quercetin dioxygenase-like cupin family protein
MKIVTLPDVPATGVNMDGVKGATKQVPVGVADGAPNFSLRVFTLEPGGHTPYHNHPWEHENYVLSGRGVIRTEDGSGSKISRCRRGRVPLPGAAPRGLQARE